MNDTTLREPWLQWAVEIQSIAQCGLAYCRDVYDIERYQRLLTLSAFNLCLFRSIFEYS